MTKIDYQKLRSELEKLMKESWAQKVIEIVKSCEEGVMVGINCKLCGWIHDDYDCTPATDRPIVAEQQGGENAKIARARRALERIRNVGRDRSEKLWYRVDDMVDEADDALRFLAL